MRQSLISKGVVAVGILAISAGWIRAEGEPAQLTEMRVKYEEAKKDAVLPVMRAYGRALREKMTEYTQAGKLDQALAFKKEMERVAEEVLAATEAGIPAAEPSAPAVAARGKVIDFLEIIDTDLDGKPPQKWLLVEGLLSCVEGHMVPKIILPYEPPEEYDFTLTFEQPKFRNGVALIMPNGAGKVFNVAAAEKGGSVAGLSIGGFYGHEFAVTKPGLFKTARGYTLTVEVRKESITGKVDGQGDLRV